MLTAVEFDDQLEAEAEEVGNVRAHRRLAPELGVGKRLPERAPQSLLSICRIAPQAACVIDGAGGRFGVIPHTLTLSRLRRSFPLPMGEGGARAAQRRG